LHELINSGFDIIVAGIFSAPFDETWLGKRIDISFVTRLKTIKERYGISLTGEGGEYESFVCDAPFFKQRIVITSSDIVYKNHNGRYLITGAKLEVK
jgi:uncharacterized protein (TIGR00290 family)